MRSETVDVFVLGAGFSRAVSSAMPLLSELGEEIAARLGATGMPDGVRLAPTNFEQWLSFLAEDQPWLDEPERLKNRASFVTVSRLLSDVIRERERQARTEQMPDWLRALVARWHEDRSSVITFNYDDLVEAAFTEVVSVKTRANDEHEYVSHAQLQRDPLSPIGSREGAVFTSSRIETFTLTKLHGSRSWLYSGRPSFFGEPIFDACRTRSWAPEDEDPRPWLAQDKVPLIVPPTAGKTGFFDNETIRSAWRRAYLDLRACRRLFIVGYSVPPSDLLVRFLLQQGCAENSSVVVVNPDESVQERVGQMLRDAGLRVAVESVASVEDLAAAMPPSDPAPLVLRADLA